MQNRGSLKSASLKSEGVCIIKFPSSGQFSWSARESVNKIRGSLCNKILVRLPLLRHPPGSLLTRSDDTCPPWLAHTCPGSLSLKSRCRRKESLRKKIYAERTDQRGRGSLSMKSEGVCIIKFSARSGQEGVAIIKFLGPKSDFRARARFFWDSLLYRAAPE